MVNYSTCRHPCLANYVNNEAVRNWTSSVNVVISLRSSCQFNYVFDYGKEIILLKSLISTPAVGLRQLHCQWEAGKFSSVVKGPSCEAAQ